jgi:outer membrane protein assembly factor BamB
MVSSNLIFIGVKGYALALDRATGAQIWATPLRGSDFVNVALIDGELYAATKGELYCLDTATGQIRWHNPLKGRGRGLVAIAAPGVQGGQMIAFEKQQRDRKAAAAAAAAGASG